ncbi:hypothetical protein [Pedobacter sp. NJ-S-72]
MQTFKFFEQEDNIYHFKVQKSYFYAMAIIAFCAMIATLIYGTTKGSYAGAAILAFIVVMAILRSTASMQFDVKTREIQRKSFYFSSPVTYSFDNFDHFLVSKLKSAFITLGISGILVMERNGKMINILLYQCFFTSRPLQRLSDELYDIMGLPQ